MFKPTASSPPRPSASFLNELVPPRHACACLPRLSPRGRSSTACVCHPPRCDAPNMFTAAYRRRQGSVKLGVEPDRTTGHKLQFLHISDSRRLNRNSRHTVLIVFFETYIQNIFSFF
jgi:hypothetical protein